MLIKHALATCLEQQWSAECAEFASIVIVNLYLVITIHCKQLHTFCSALQITSVVVKWNYNYKLLCLKTCNHYVVITFGFSITTTYADKHVWWWLHNNKQQKTQSQSFWPFQMLQLSKRWSLLKLFIFLIWSAFLTLHWKSCIKVRFLGQLYESCWS